MELSFQVPELIIVACAGLLAFFGIFLVRMLWEYHRAIRAIRSLKRALGSVKPIARDERRHGLRLDHVEEIRVKCAELPGAVKRWWSALDDALERYTSSENREGWFLGDDVRRLIPEQTAVGQYYHGSFHQAVPGILTGIGLAVTFTSILWALKDVRPELTKDGTEIVRGIMPMIGGLAGKFLSSIIALLLSVVFTLVERGWCERRLTATYESLLLEIGDVFPTISPLRVLLDVQVLAKRQATSFGNISADIVNRFVGVFQSNLAPVMAAGISQEMAKELQTEFRPTMQAMTQTLEKLHGAIERLESQKQESITGELRGLIESLELSIRTALEEMGRSFHSSLTGAAEEEFSGMAKTLGVTSQVLENLNTQFDRMQAGLQQVIDGAREATHNQLATGRDQVEALTRLMEGLMTRLNQTADANLQNVSTALTTVVEDLSRRVGDLSRTMVETVSRATQESQQTASSVIQQAGTWSETSAKRLDALVSAIEARSQEFAAAGRTLLAAHESMKQTLANNKKALDSIAGLADKLQTFTVSLVGVGKNAEEVQKGQLQVTVITREATQNLKAAISIHESFLEQYRTVFREYQSVFNGLDNQLRAVLESINSGLQKYHQSVESNFRSIVGVTNTALPQIANTLKAEIDQLSDKLEELSDVLDKGIEGLRR